jgi:hypothetical protein
MATASQFSPLVTNNLTATITIASDDDLSQAVDLCGTQLVGIYTPSNFDGTGIVLWASDAIDGTYVAVQTGITSATQQPITTAASRYIPLTPDITEGLRFIKVGTASAQTTTNTVLTLATKAR